MLVRTGIGLEENVNHVSGRMRDKNGNKNKNKDKARDNGDGGKRRWDQVQSYFRQLGVYCWRCPPGRRPTGANTVGRNRSVAFDVLDVA
jgi:hypothetical protein